MLSIKLPTDVERHLEEVVRESYNGDLQVAITSFLRLHEKYGWKERLSQDVESIRAEVRRRGGISSRAIDEAVKRYRKQRKPSHA
jgi:hypothetical protein